jgi:hypothetical protein
MRWRVHARDAVAVAACVRSRKLFSVFSVDRRTAVCRHTGEMWRISARPRGSARPPARGPVFPPSRRARAAACATNPSQVILWVSGTMVGVAAAVPEGRRPVLGVRARADSTNRHRAEWRQWNINGSVEHTDAAAAEVRRRQLDDAEAQGDTRALASVRIHDQDGARRKLSRSGNCGVLGTSFDPLRRRGVLKLNSGFQPGHNAARNWSRRHMLLQGGAALVGPGCGAGTR